jgi:rhamnosyltransferase
MAEVAPDKKDIAAVVVLYRPDATVPDNIASYAAQVDRVFVVDNSEEPDIRIVSRVSGLPGVTYVENGDNLGVATALNIGTRAAMSSGYSWALTLDQDSTAPAGFVDMLALCCEARVSIVAPVWQQVGGLAEPTSDECRDIDRAISSGNLLRLGALESVGGFDDDLFIDQVDHDLSFRLRLAGWRIVQARGAALRHRQGNLRRTAWGFHTTDYPAIRRYYMARNTAVMLRRYGRAFPKWAADERMQWIRDIAKILLGEPDRVTKLRMIARGRRDAAAGVLGRYTGGGRR